jgi:flagellar protein FliL
MAVKKSFKVLLIGVVLSLAAFGVWYFVHAQPTTEAKVVPLSVPVFLQLDSFTVNLKQDGQFLQVQFTLQLETEADVTKIKMYIPQVRSRILLLLSNKTADELSTTDGKQTLNKQIVEVISEPLRIDLAPIKVVNVFATSFIIQ